MGFFDVLEPSLDGVAKRADRRRYLLLPSTSHESVREAQMTVNVVRKRTRYKSTVQRVHGSGNPHDELVLGWMAGFILCSSPFRCTGRGICFQQRRAGGCRRKSHQTTQNSDLLTTETARDTSEVGEATQDAGPVLRAKETPDKGRVLLPYGPSRYGQKPHVDGRRNCGPLMSDCTPVVIIEGEKYIAFPIA